MTTWLERWWRQPGHYGWFSGYLHARGLGVGARIMMASTVGSLALCLIALLFSADGPRGAGPVAMTWIAFAGGVAGVALWASTWPTHRESAAFAVVTSMSIALACLAHFDPRAALIGCVAFATTGGYVAFFHTSKYVTYNFVVAAAVAVYEAARLAASGHAALAGVDLFLVLQVNLALPLAIQVLIRVVGKDLVRADLDPLTGLCNRRAFQQQTLDLITAGPVQAPFLLIAVVDLDDFKCLNDRDGHSAGDRALVAVAAALRACTYGAAVIARSGGEEFTIADTSLTGDPVPLARRICQAVAELPAGITASVGTSCARLDGLDDADRCLTLVARLVGEADEAMYRAKHNGGNGFHDVATALDGSLEPPGVAPPFESVANDGGPFREPALDGTSDWAADQHSPSSAETTADPTPSTNGDAAATAGVADTPSTDQSGITEYASADVPTPTFMMATVQPQNPDAPGDLEADSDPSASEPEQPTAASWRPPAPPAEPAYSHAGTGSRKCIIAVVAITLIVVLAIGAAYWSTHDGNRQADPPQSAASSGWIVVGESALEASADVTGNFRP